MKSNARFLAGFALILLIGAAQAGELSKERRDSGIDEIASVTLPGNAISDIQIGAQRQHNYVYLKDTAHRTLTVIDVTDAARPALKKAVSTAALPEAYAVGMAAGDVALLIGDEVTRARENPKTISIIDFANPANPRVALQFAHVTAMRVDEARSLIYLVDWDGLHILQRYTIQAPGIEKDSAK